LYENCQISKLLLFLLFPQQHYEPSAVEAKLSRQHLDNNAVKSPTSTALKQQPFVNWGRSNDNTSPKAGFDPYSLSRTELSVRCFLIVIITTVLTTYIFFSD